MVIKLTKFTVAVVSNLDNVTYCSLDFSTLLQYVRKGKDGTYLPDTKDILKFLTKKFNKPIPEKMLNVVDFTEEEHGGCTLQRPVMIQLRVTAWEAYKLNVA